MAKNQSKYKTKKEIKYQMDLLFQKYADYLRNIIIRDRNVNYRTILLFSILNRSQAITAAYKKILATNNLMVLNGLTRMQLDNCIFVHGVYLLNKEGIDIETICTDLLYKNKRLKDYKLQHKLSDQYIINDIDSIYNNKIKDMYKFYCSFIHFSDRALLSTLSFKDDNIIELMVAKKYGRFNEDIMINASSFVELSKFILILLNKEWKEIEYMEIVAN